MSRRKGAWCCCHTIPPFVGPRLIVIGLRIAFATPFDLNSVGGVICVTKNLYYSKRKRVCSIHANWFACS